MKSHVRKYASSLIIVFALTLGSTAKAQTLTTCPNDDATHPLPTGTQCYNGRDANGAYYLIAIPSNYNGQLLLHCHGGPLFSYETITPLTHENDLGPFSVRDVLNKGWAIAASSYAQVGWAVTKDAADSENLRQIFAAAFGRASRTIVEGNSFGAVVAAMVAEKFAVAPDGTRNYNAAMPICGLVGGVLRQGYLLSDQRTVYQYYCNNLPLPNETQYDLYRGVDDPGITTPTLATQRVNACTGLNLAPAQRTPAQQAALSNIKNVLTIRSDADATMRLTRGLFHLYDITANQQGGLNAFHSLDAVFRGSTDDTALNAAITRYPAVQSAVQLLMDDADPTGHVSIPVATLHAENDERAWPEMESVYRDTFTDAGTDNLLLQMFTTEGGHCGFTIPEFQAVFNSLNDWISTGTRPIPPAVAASCVGDNTACRFDPGYVPADWSARQPRRPQLPLPQTLARGVFYLAPIGGGAGASTMLTLRNPSGTKSVNGTVSFFGSDGRLLDAAVSNAVVPFLIPSSATVTIRTNSQGPFKAGYARVSSPDPVIASATYSIPGFNSLLIGPSTPEAFTFIASISREIPKGIEAGVSVTNVSDTTVRVVLSLADSSGKPVKSARTSVFLAPGEQLGRVLSELFSGLSEKFAGTLRVTALSPFPSRTIIVTVVQVRPGLFNVAPLTLLGKSTVWEEETPEN